eukprot:Clim_evm23s239 gene=Clim_evmTU23s239
MLGQLSGLRARAGKLATAAPSYGTVRFYVSGKTLVEKIVEHHAEGLAPGESVTSGEFVTIRPKHVMTHDNTGAVLKKLEALEALKGNKLNMNNSKQPVFTLDHNVQDKSEGNLKKYAKIGEFAADRGVDFYPAGRGIGHQIMCEEGYVSPGSMVVASDSHSNMYGGLGCLGTPVVRTDAVSIWLRGTTWWQVPQVSKVLLKGKLPVGVTGKDVIITLCGVFNKDEVLNHAIEFEMEHPEQFSVDDRLAVANMTTEWGAVAGLFPADEITKQWYVNQLAFLESRRPSRKVESRLARMRKIVDTLDQVPRVADANAQYAKVLELDLSTVRPHVSGPNHVKIMEPITDLLAIEIDKAYLVSCVNSRASDIRLAAEVIGDQKVAENVEFYVAAASSEVQQACEEDGVWQKLLAAGAKPLPAGCGPCIGLGEGLLQEGEVGISATNRNFKGRMGHKNALAYLASPAVVAASAVSGYITAPAGLVNSSPVEIKFALKEIAPGTKSNKKITFIDGFAQQLQGPGLFVTQDNINTDGIYPGKYTYNDNISLEEQAKVSMENYDPAFLTMMKPNSVLVAGFNFGTGSSREQAATCLKAAGIQMVIAGSFSETYKRNALNNGLLAVECPSLVTALKSKYSSNDNLTVQLPSNVLVNFTESSITFGGDSFPIAPIGPVAQELIVTGGLEEIINRSLA